MMLWVWLVLIHLALAFASCCGIEFMATMASHYDLHDLVQSEVFPRQGYVDGNGTISKKWRLFYVKYMSKWQSLNGYCC
jgi:NADH:ubiquinone oxidoreductase subunit B-like Fe-S oxidoreductase